MKVTSSASRCDNFFNISCKSCITTKAAIAFLLLFTLPNPANTQSPPAILTWTASSPLHTFDSTFLSVNIDTASLDARMDLTDPTLHNLVRQLGDAWLRVGGTASNALVYEPNGHAGDVHGAVHINDAYWAQLVAFASATGSRLLFGMPLQLNSMGVYDPTINATALWGVTEASGYQVGGWSLGNELIGGTGFNSTTYAADYKIFAATLQKFPSIGQDVFGPSAAGFPGEEVIAPFMTATAPLLTAFTYHAYAFKNCSLDVYTVKKGVEHMGYYISAYGNLRDSIAPTLPLVLEEAATQADGGCEGLSDRFVSGFWWIHTLGMAAEGGTSRVQRQDVAGFSFNGRASHYQLAGVAGWINSSFSGPLTPHPDWYTAVLHKQLAGNAILASQLSIEYNETVGVHVWCAAEGAGAPKGAVTLSYVNMGDANVSLSLPQGTSFPRVEYILQPGPSSSPTSKHEGAAPSSLTSDTMLLNGVQLVVGEDGMLPVYPIPGNRVEKGTEEVLLPEWSYGFIVLEGAGAAAC